MTLPWHICVLIPARNEEELLPRCLSSILHARTKLPSRVTCDIVVAVDASTDQTASIAKEMLAGYGTIVSTNAGVVGSARAAAARTALKRYKGPIASCWLAHTDADCMVPEEWLLKQILLAENGIEAVAGTITVDTFKEYEPGAEQRFRRSYIVLADGTHPHIHGANLGVRADVYRKAGGWAELATAEDHDLWNRLHLVGCSKISTAAIRVITSGRQTGRAPHGFAEALAAHNE